MNQINEEVTFKSNPNLKQPGVVHPLTFEQTLEMARCSADPVYFIENYLKVVTLDHGEQPFKLFDYQRDYIRSIHENRFNIARWARQMGKSTTCAAYFVWRVIFMPKQFIAIMANKADTAQEILFRVKEMYETVPTWLQQGVLTWNARSILLENKSRVISSATSSSAIRGKTVNILFIDEVAHIPTKMWENFYLSSYPTITSGTTTKMILVSTPKGLNHFYDLYKGSPENGFIVSDASWERHPNRDAKWLEETKNKVTEEQFAQEYECSWLGSSYSLINPGTLSIMLHKEPVSIVENLWIFEEPVKEISETRHGKKIVTQPEGKYIISADVSEGLGMDSSAFSVFRVIDSKNGILRQVASFKDNRTDPTSYAAILYRTGMFFNTAHILVESNDAGKLVIRHLKVDLEYPNMIRTKIEDDPSFPNKDKSREYGLRVSKRTKRIGCINLKMFVERSRFEVNCKRTIEEFKHFVRPPDVAERDGSYQADQGHNDDLVMGMVNLAFLFSTKTFERMFDTDNLINMFEQTVKDSSISKAMDEIHLPITRNSPNNLTNLWASGQNSRGGLHVVNRNVHDLDPNERKWFNRN